MPDTLTVPAAFNGPRESGNGGYAAGALAAFVGEPAEVSLRSPVPLDRELSVVGEVEGRGLVASTWVPPTWVEEQGDVPRELIWAVLDCPTYFATHMEGEMSA